MVSVSGDCEWLDLCTPVVSAESRAELLGVLKFAYRAVESGVCVCLWRSGVPAARAVGAVKKT